MGEESRVVCEKFSLEYTLGKETTADDELLFIEPSMVFVDEITAYRQEMLDVFSTYSDGNRIGNEQFYWVDTISQKYGPI